MDSGSAGGSFGRVLVTPRSLTQDPTRVTELLRKQGLEPVLGPAGKQPGAEQLATLLPGCVGWLAGVEPIGEGILREHPDLRVISRFGVGTDSVDLEAARRLGIRVRIAAGANAQSVAELALGLTLDGIRGITHSHGVLASGGWERGVGKEVGDIVVAVAGYGSIGRIYADLVVRLGGRVRVFDPMLSPEAPLAEGVTRVDSLSAAVSGVDVLSFHCPPTGKPLFDAALREACTPGLVVINTARSELVDDSVMLEALNSGVVSVYAVDAFDSEPPEPSALLSHPRVIATPHLGALTESAIGRTLDVAVENLAEALAAPRLLRERPYRGPLRQELSSEAQEGVLQLHWLGQAGFALRTSSGRVILIDPYLSDSLKKKYAGTVFPHVRMMPAPIEADAFPRVDLVLCTHGHTDHLDPGTLPAIASTHPDALFIAPERVREIALERGVPESRLLGARGGDVLTPFPEITISPIPSAHETLDITREGSAFLGYVIEVEGVTIYHSGDCVPFPELEELLLAHAPDVALLPVNGRDEFRLTHGVPGNFTLAEALDTCARAHIPTMVAHHWGMFDFNTVDRDELYHAWLGHAGNPAWYIPSAGGYWEYRPGSADFEATRGIKS